MQTALSNLQAAVRMLAPEITEAKAFCNRVSKAVSANAVPGAILSATQRHCDHTFSDDATLIVVAVQ